MLYTEYFIRKLLYMFTLFIFNSIFRESKQCIRVQHRKILKCLLCNEVYNKLSFLNIFIQKYNYNTISNKEMLYYHLSRWSITCDESSTSKEISDRKNNKKSIWKYRFQFYSFLLQTTFLVCCKNESILLKKIYRS